jgi:hypothetical protein
MENMSEREGLVTKFLLENGLLEDKHNPHHDAQGRFCSAGDSTLYVGLKPMGHGLGGELLGPRRELPPTEGPKKVVLAFPELWRHHAHEFEVTMLPRAAIAKKAIDRIAQSILDSIDGTTEDPGPRMRHLAAAPNKGVNRAVEKFQQMLKDSGGKVQENVTMLKDLQDVARNTCVVPKDKIAETVAKLRAAGIPVRDGFDVPDKMGYTGGNAKYKARGTAGIFAEIQVNSPEMIFAKEAEKDARVILDGDYERIAAKMHGIEGGRGHKMYEEWRQLPSGHPRRAEIEAESREYYGAIQSR